MKKFKLIAASLLASSMVLAGCDKNAHQHFDGDLDHKCDDCGEVISSCVDKNKDHLCDACGTSLTEHVDEDKNHVCDICEEKFTEHVDADGDHVCDVCEENIPVVSSVKVIASQKEMEIGSTLKLSANVTSYGGASTAVNWSVDNELIASISEEGVVTALAFGKVVVTATSVEDETKSDSAEIEIVFGTSLSELDYTHTAEFPEADIKTFLGEGEYEVFGTSKDVAKGGYWGKATEGDDEYAGYYTVIVNLDIMNLDDDVNERGELFFEELNSSESLIYFNDYMEYMDCYMDSTGTYFILVTQAVDSEEEHCYVAMNYYKTSELFSGSYEVTEDEDWSDDFKYVMNLTFGEELPFMQFGADYDGMAQYGMLILMDFSANIGLGSEYADLLLESGYKYSEVEGIYYKESSLDATKAIGIELAYAVGYGNLVIVSTTENIFSEYPAAQMDSFISEVVKSEVELPAIEIESPIPVPPPLPPLLASRALSADKDYEFRFRIKNDEYDQYEFADQYAEVSCLLVTQVDFGEYIESLLSAGFVINDLMYYSYSKKDFAYSYKFVKDDLGVVVELNPETSFGEAGQEINWDRSTMIITVFRAIPFPSIYFVDGEGYSVSSGTAIVGGETLNLKLTSFRLGNFDDLVITYESEDEEIATVDAEGKVTAVCGGSTKIIARTTYNEEEYTAEFTVTCYFPASKEELSFKEAIIGVAEPTVTAEGTTLTFSEGVSYDESSGVVTLKEGDSLAIKLGKGHTFSEIRFDGVESIEDLLKVQLPSGEELDGLYVVENYFFDGPNDEWYYTHYEDWVTHNELVFVASGDLSISGLCMYKDDGAYMFGHGSFASIVAEIEQGLVWYDAERTDNVDGSITFKWDSWYSVADTEGYEAEDWWEFVVFNGFYGLPMCFIADYVDDRIEVKYDEAKDLYYMDCFTYDHEILAYISYEVVTEGEGDEAYEEYYMVITVSENK